MYCNEEWVSLPMTFLLQFFPVLIREPHRISFILCCRYTAEEDFLNADAVFDCIGDPPEERFDLAYCGSLLEKQYVS